MSLSVVSSGISNVSIIIIISTQNIKKIEENKICIETAAAKKKKMKQIKLLWIT